jgi:hypothetical protein
VGRPTRARVSDNARGQDSAAVPSARTGRYWMGRLGGLAWPSRGLWGSRHGRLRCCSLPAATSVTVVTVRRVTRRERLDVLERLCDPSRRVGPSVRKGDARERVVSCRPREGVVVQQHGGLAAWRWRTRLGTEQRADAGAGYARRGCCSVPACGDRGLGVGSPLPRSTGDGHRGAGAGPRVTADKERLVGQFAASAPPTRRRRHLTTVSVRPMSSNLLEV